MCHVRFIVLGFIFSGMFAGELHSREGGYFEKTLPNGFRIMVYENPELPTVFGGVAVNAGSKNDPADATGMAHYLEHMLFKGTTELGTTDYAREKIILDSITLMYDSLGRTKAADQRLLIQLAINKLSVRAAAYVIPNEMDRMLSEIGSTGVNATTSAENTIFYNLFPATQLEKWMAVYAHRFEKPVFRLFQAELEVVYEEKNRSMDDLFTNLLETYSKQFYKKHPYGQQTTIGTTEHLKNPPLSKMYAYFDTYYVPNNMALIVSGDLDHESVFQLAEKYFGHWKSKPIPVFPQYKEEEFKGREIIRVRQTPVKVAVRGYRIPKNNDPDNAALRVMEYLLSNEKKTGALDKLVHDHKIMMAGVEPYVLNDYGGEYIYIVPRILIQSTRKAEHHVLQCVEELKKGNFDDVELQSAKQNLVLEREKTRENNRSLFYAMLHCFSTGQTWEDYEKYTEELMQVSREDVMRVCSKYIGENCLALYSSMGKAHKDKLAKPPFEPVVPKSDTSSAFYTKWQHLPVSSLTPRFVDFNSDVMRMPVRKGDTLYHVKTNVNNIGRYDIRFRVGKKSIPELKYLPVYLAEAESDKISAQAFRRSMDALGCDMEVLVYDYSVFVRVSGMDENLDSALHLCSDFLHSLQSNQRLFKRLLREEAGVERLDKKQPATYVRMLKDYALFGENSPYLKDISRKKIRKQGIASLLNQWQRVFTYAADIYYSGPSSPDKVLNKLKHAFDTGTCEQVDDHVSDVLDMKKENVIYIYNMRKARQSHLVVLKDAGNFTPGNLTEVYALNRYYGGDMSSLVFQEIREFRSLAYATAGRLDVPRFNGDDMFFETYVACQDDKTNEAADIMLQLANDMPWKPERQESVRNGLKEYCASSAPDLRTRAFYPVIWTRRGFGADPMEKMYTELDKFDMQRIFSFYTNQVKENPYTLVIVGNTRKMNIEMLKKHAQVVFLKEHDFVSR